MNQIALLSRRSPTDNQIQQFLEWGQQGITVNSYVIDVSDKEALSEIYSQVKHAQGPVKTVIHSAGILADATLLNQTADHIHRVNKSKVYGAWYLHELTCHDELENFIVFSSMAGVLGSPGQSNYAAANVFLDALVQHRHRLGLPGISIGWGAWGETGMAVSYVTRLEEKLSTRQGLDALHLILSNVDKLKNIGVMPVDWTRYHHQDGLVRSILKDFLTESDSNKRRLNIKKQENSTIDNKLLYEVLSRELAMILQYDDSDLIDLHISFFELGMDSSGIITYADRINQLFEMNIDPYQLYQYSTLEELIQYLQELQCITEFT